MATSDTLSEADLPLPTDEFVDRLIDDVDGFMHDHGLDESRFKEQLTEDQMRQGLLTRAYGEFRVGKILIPNMDECEDPRIYVQLAKQIEDEFKHGRLLSNRLRELGADPSRAAEHENPLSKEYWEAVSGLDIVETTAMLQCGAERFASRRHPEELQYYDDETAEIYESVIAPDEKFHAQVGVNVLRTYCDDYETQRSALEASRRGRELTIELHDESYREAYGAAD
jgi:hypothetical protein